MQHHLDEPLTPQRLAGVAHLSTYHFHRIFSGLVGESLGEHVRRLRLERAAGELRRSERAVIDVALDAGYDAHEAFTRAFRAHFGMPPSLYRKASEPIGFPPALCGVHYGADEGVSRFVPLPEGSHMVEVRIESLPPRRLVALAHRGTYQGIADKFKQLRERGAAASMVGPSTGGIGIYYDDPESTPVDELRSHACITVDERAQKAPDGCDILTLEGGEYAIGVHRGSYASLGESYRWLFGQWLPTSGREPAHNPVHEQYLSGPDTPEADLITHICVPLVPAAQGAPV